MNVKIESGWGERLVHYFEQASFLQLRDFVREEYRTQTVFPPPAAIFHAFDACPFDQTRVVILGQDPYHGPGQAHGLAFSVKDGISIPPSLRNIYKELQSDLNLTPPRSGDLTRWARQGVLLLNATLTVRAHQAGAHQGRGWEEFTDTAIKVLAEEKKHLVFMLWGSYAQRKGAFVDDQNHLVLKAPHPSPLSASKGFLGCKHFSRANAYLDKHHGTFIQW